MFRARTTTMAALLLLAASVVLVTGPAPGGLPVWKALVLGAVEGLTEFLPVSSTGHLLVAARAMHLGTAADGTALGTYVVAIQMGAIAAVLGIYWDRIRALAGFVVGSGGGVEGLATALAIAFMPIAAVGAAAGSTIKERLFGPWPIVAAWAIGGVLLLVWRPRSKQAATPLLAISKRQAATIGLAQVIALWPGTSRSLVTLLAGLGVGLTITAAVELTFLLGALTLSAASVWELAHNGTELVGVYGWVTPGLGALTALVTAAASVRWMTAHLEHRTLRAFGVYRLGLAGFTALLVVVGAL